MIVYVIKNAEGELLEICSSVATAFAWLINELDETEVFKVERIHSNFIINTESEHYEIIKWSVFD